jgi:succinyl-diaminopimelate desuccinylase
MNNQDFNDRISDKAIDEWMDMHFDEYVRVLTQYVSFPSVATPDADGLPFGKGCADMLSFIEDLMQRYGLETDNVDTRAVIGTLKGTSGTKRIGIACHGDVVPPEGEWDRNPFELWRNGDDWLTGRGSTDNKGATIATLFAIRFLKEQGIRLKNDVQLFVGSAEEIGMQDMDYVLEHRSAPDFTMVPDSGFPVAHGEKGSMRFEAEAELTDGNLISFTAGERGASVADHATAEIRSEDAGKVGMLNACENITATLENGIVRVSSMGKARHTAYPQEGLDAIGQLARALDRTGIVTGRAGKLIADIGRFTEDFYGTGLGIACEDDVSGRLTSVLTVIRVREGKLWIKFGICHPVTANVPHMQDTIKKLLQDAGWSCMSMTGRTPTYVPVSPLLQKLNDIANEVHETDDPPYIMAGGTYARKLPNAIAYGMGTPSKNTPPPYPAGQGRAHQPNESVYIPRMKKGMKIYVKALLAVDEAL